MKPLFILLIGGILFMPPLHALPSTFLEFGNLMMESEAEPSGTTEQQQKVPAGDERMETLRAQHRELENLENELDLPAGTFNYEGLRCTIYLQDNCAEYRISCGRNLNFMCNGNIHFDSQLCVAAKKHFKCDYNINIAERQHQHEEIYKLIRKIFNEDYNRDKEMGGYGIINPR